MKIAVAALLLLVAGCGGSDDKDGGFVGPPADQSVQIFFDLGVGGACSASTVQASCATGSECVACLTLGASGVCVQPCRTAAPACAAGTTCTSFGDGGAADLVFGGSCAGYDGVCQ